MTRIKLFAYYASLILLISFMVTLLVTLVPSSYFDNKLTAFVLGLLVTLFTAGITGITSYYFNRFIDRPILRLEHVDFKSERQPFKLNDELWWKLTHSGLVEYVNKRVQWPITCFEKNQFLYYQLQDIEGVIDQIIDTYSGTSRWTKNLIAKIETFKAEKSHEVRSQLLMDLSTDIVKFADHYRETRKSSLYVDLITKPDEATEFLQSETQALLIMHERELCNYFEFKDWISSNLKKGENPPKEIDHYGKKVPTIKIVIGIANIGRTPALIKHNGTVTLDGNEIPVRLAPGQSNIYIKVDPNQVLPLLFEIDQNKCGFDLNSTIYRALTSTNSNSRVKITLFMADNVEFSKKNVLLADNTSLPI